MNYIPRCWECDREIAYGIYKVTREVKKGLMRTREEVLCAPCGLSLPSKGYSRMKDVKEEHTVEAAEINGYKFPAVRVQREYTAYTRVYPVQLCILKTQIITPAEWEQARVLNNVEREAKRQRRNGVSAKPVAVSAPRTRSAPLLPMGSIVFPGRSG